MESLEQHHLLGLEREVVARLVEHFDPVEELAIEQDRVAVLRHLRCDPGFDLLHCG